MTARVSLTAVVSGRVQGVNFRDFTRLKAQALGVSGYVRNLPGGSVEVLAEGERPALENLLCYLQQGPPRASVEGVAATWGESTGEVSGFRIRY